MILLLGGFDKLPIKSNYGLFEESLLEIILPCSQPEHLLSLSL